MWRSNTLVFTAHPIVISSYVARDMTHSSQQPHDIHAPDEKLNNSPVASKHYESESVRQTRNIIHNFIGTDSVYMLQYVSV